MFLYRRVLLRMSAKGSMTPFDKLHGIESKEQIVPSASCGMTFVVASLFDKWYGIEGKEQAALRASSAISFFLALISRNSRSSNDMHFATNAKASTEEDTKERIRPVLRMTA